MKKLKTLLNILLIFVLILSFSACGNKPESGGNTGGGTGTTTIVNNTPETVMDMFDGERKVWFLIDRDHIAYDSPVNVIFVTENKQIIAGYYYIPDYHYSTENSSTLEFWTEDSQPQTCYKQYSMSDFDQLSDDEIISMVSKNYADVSKKYHLTPAWIGESTLNANILPRSITYSGELDSSGNNLKSEKISLFNEDYYYSVPMNYILQSEYNFSNVLSSTTIKSKNYVGLNCTFSLYDDGMNYHAQLITRDIFNDLRELKLDSPEGASELY